MATLTKAQKSFIVTALARFHSPSEVVELVKQDFGFQISRQQVDYYNPTTASSKGHLASRWAELFEIVRERYVRSLEQVAIAHERYRLEQLQRIVEDRMRRGDHVTAMKALEQAAKERGNAYTNVRDIQSQSGQLPNIYVYGGTEEGRESASDSSMRRVN